ncbi:MAG TPA: hypothetical protein VGV12_12060 [Gemmatimonadales bacterium]|nr:hypothetical protein [Gemmatimonadales bacterium]
MNWWSLVAADTLQHAVKHDTVIVHDTVRVVDTVRVLVNEGESGWVAIGAIVAVASAVGAGVWKLIGFWRQRQQAHQRINAEAFSLHRELEASIGTGPEKDQASIWTQACQRGFDSQEERFDRLTEYALQASKEVRHLIRDERHRFLNAAKVVNESLVGAWSGNKAKAADGVYRELQACLTGLSKVIEKTRE